MYAWERVFSDKVEATRAGEVRLLRKLAYLKAVNIFLLLSTPVLVCMHPLFVPFSISPAFS